jgi:NDP-sugar pyrophosphorylase family protein
LDRFAKAKRPLDWVDVVDALLSDGRPVGTTRIAGWMDAGTPTDLLTLNSQMLVPQTLERISDRLPGSAASASVWTQGNPPILSGVELRGTVLIGAHVSIGGGSIIENTVIGPGARIGVNARVSGSLVLPGGKIRSNAIVMTDVVDRA